MVARTDETDGGYVIANCKGQDVLSFVPPMQKHDDPEASDGSEVERATGRTSSSTPQSPPDGPRIGAAAEVRTQREQKRNTESGYGRNVRPSQTPGRMLGPRPRVPPESMGALDGSSFRRRGEGAGGYRAGGSGRWAARCRPSPLCCAAHGLAPHRPAVGRSVVRKFHWFGCSGHWQDPVRRADEGAGAASPWLRLRARRRDFAHAGRSHEEAAGVSVLADFAF